MDNEPIRIELDLDSAEKEIASAPNALKDLNAAIEYFKSAGKLAKEAEEEAKRIIKKGTRTALEIPPELRSAFRGIAASMSLKEENTGSGVRYRKNNTSSLRTFVSTIAEAIQQAMTSSGSSPSSIAKTVGTAVSAPVNAVTSAANNMPALLSPAQQKKKDKEDAQRLKDSAKLSAQQVKEFEKEQREKARLRRQEERQQQREKQQKDREHEKRMNAAHHNTVEELKFVAREKGFKLTPGMTHPANVFKNLQHVMSLPNKGGGEGGSGAGGGFFKNLFGLLTFGGGGGGGMSSSIGMMGGAGAGVAMAAAFLKKVIDTAVAAIHSFINAMENMVASLGRLNPAIIAQTKMYEVQKMLAMRQLSFVMQPAMEAWLNLKKYLLSLLDTLTPVFEMLSRWIVKIVDFIIWIIESIKPYIPVLISAIGGLLEGLGNTIKAFAAANKFISKFIPNWAGGGIISRAADAADKMGDILIGAASDVRDAVDKMLKEDTDEQKKARRKVMHDYSQAFLDAMRTMPQGHGARGGGTTFNQTAGAAGSSTGFSPFGQQTVNHGYAGSEYLRPGAGHEFLFGGKGHEQNARVSAKEVGHSVWSQTQAGLSAKTNDKVNVPKAAAPRMDVKNQFQMKIDMEKALQESLAQVRDFLLQSVFGVRAEMHMMQSQLDPRGRI